MQASIDVVVPSFRLEEKYILPILQLNIPDSAIIKFYIIVDNPKVKPSQAILSLVDNEKIFLIINQQNLGAALTRNIGINAGEGRWILFLDDDVVVKPDLIEVYFDNIKNSPNEIGFIGLVEFSEPLTLFDKAVKASGSIDVFSIAARKPSFAWGATANLMVNRAAMKHIRFDQNFPKNGGAEDIDFFVRVREQNQFKNYLCLPFAKVSHPWWNAGKPNFNRSFRYGNGSSMLFKQDPDYTYYDFLNTAETMLILVLTLLVSVFISLQFMKLMALFLVGSLIIEFIANTIQSLKRKAGLNLLGISYLMLLRLSFQFGLLLGNLSLGRINALGMRFNDDGSFNKLHFYRFNSYKMVKWILYPVLLFFLFKRYT